MDLGEFTRGLRCTMLLGAARAEARGDRLVALRELEHPLRAAVEVGDWDEAERLIRGVMPDGWESPVEWQVPD